MDLLRIGNINARGLSSPWKEAIFSTTDWSLSVNIVVISDTRLSDRQAFIHILWGYQICLSLCVLRHIEANTTAVLFRSGHDLKVRTIFLNPEGKLLNNSDWNVVLKPCLAWVELALQIYSHTSNYLRGVWLAFPNVSIWTWTNRIVPSKLYLDRIFCRLVTKLG